MLKCSLLRLWILALTDTGDADMVQPVAQNSLGRVIIPPWLNDRQENRANLCGYRFICAK
jgi:hypothetical protein